MSPLIYIVFIAISLIASITVYFQSGMSIYLRVFPIFLLCTLVVELVAYHLGSNGISPITLYNFFTPVEFLFYMFVLRAVILNKRMKLIIFHTAWVYLLLVSMYFIFIQRISVFSSTTYAFGSLLIKRATLQGFIVLDHYAKLAEVSAQLAEWIADGSLEPLETVVEGFEQLPKAINMLFDGANVGKLVVRVGA